MKIVGLLSWYEESPAWLVECVASAARVCDHLIAADGPYAMFPGALRKPFSGTEQADAILRTAAGAGIGCTLHAPREPWWGGEIEKRDFMFHIGSAFTTAADWYLRIDADEFLTTVPPDVKQRLAATELNVAEVTLWEREASAQVAELVDTSADYETPFRCLFRALPSIRIEQAHYIVTADNPAGGRFVLRGNDNHHKQDDAEQLLDLRLEHRTRLRPAGRQRIKQIYGAAIPELEPVSPFEEIHA